MHFETRGFNLPYCSKCGRQVGEEMQFCPNCGATLKTLSASEKRSVFVPSGKASSPTYWTPLANAISIGAGGTTLLGALVVALYLNRSFWTIQESLTASGLPPQQISFLLSDIRILISGAAFFAVLGLYVFVMGMVGLSPSGLAVLNSKDRRVRWGVGCFGGSMTAAGFTVQDVVLRVYDPHAMGVWYDVFFGVVSILLILLGLFLVSKARAR